MKVELNRPKVRRPVKINLGDILSHDKDFYLVCELDGKYNAKNFNGITGLLGLHNSIHELNAELNNRLVRGYEIEVYTQDEYQLILMEVTQ